MGGDVSPVPRKAWLRAVEIFTSGHRKALQMYNESMLDPKIPIKLRQEIWGRRYNSLFYGMLGRCGFLTKSFPRKWWLPKFTTRERCWIGEESRWKREED